MSIYQKIGFSVFLVFICNVMAEKFSPVEHHANTFIYSLSLGLMLGVYATSKTAPFWTTLLHVGILLAFGFHPIMMIVVGLIYLGMTYEASTVAHNNN